MEKKENKKRFTLSLFLKGMASAFDLTGRSVIQLGNGKTDVENLRSDWDNIDSDIYKSIDKTTSERLSL